MFEWSNRQPAWGIAWGHQRRPNTYPVCRKLLLHVKVLGGRAFTEYVTRHAVPGEQLVLHGELFGQRFTTQPVKAAVEPEFVGEAYIELPEERTGGGASVAGGGLTF